MGWKLPARWPSARPPDRSCPRQWLPGQRDCAPAMPPAAAVPPAQTCAPAHGSALRQVSTTCRPALVAELPRACHLVVPWSRCRCCPIAQICAPSGAAGHHCHRLSQGKRHRTPEQCLRLAAPAVCPAGWRAEQHQRWPFAGASAGNAHAAYGKIQPAHQGNRQTKKMHASQLMDMLHTSEAASFSRRPVKLGTWKCTISRLAGSAGCMPREAHVSFWSGRASLMPLAHCPASACAPA